jgi:hypothetical protein
MYLTKTVVYSAYSSIETTACPPPTALSKLFKFEKIMQKQLTLIILAKSDNDI